MFELPDRDSSAELLAKPSPVTAGTMRLISTATPVSISASWTTAQPDSPALNAETSSRKCSTWAEPATSAQAAKCYKYQEAV